MKTIAFCGIDGAGKTTQIHRIEKALLNIGKKVYVSRVNYYPFYKYENKIITQYEIRVDMGFTFARHYLELFPILQKQSYDYLLCDRHTLCHLAFAMTYGLGSSQIEALSEIFGIAGKPDITFYFDISLDDSLERIKGRKDKSPDSDETSEILGQTLLNYSKLLSTERFNDVISLNASIPIDKQTEYIMRVIEEE